MTYLAVSSRTTPKMSRTNPNFWYNLGVVRVNLGVVGFRSRTTPKLSSIQLFTKIWDLSVTIWDLSVFLYGQLPICLRQIPNFLKIVGICRRHIGSCQYFFILQLSNSSDYSQLFAQLPTLNPEDEVTFFFSLF